MSKDNNPKSKNLAADSKQYLHSGSDSALANAESRGGSPAGALRGAPPSNTAPYNYNSNNYQNFFKVLHLGIDSLYVSYKGQLSEQWALKLSELKLLAQDPDPRLQATAQAEVGDHCFEVKGRGRGKYSFVLVDNWFQIQIAGLNAQSLPVAYVQIASELLTYHPVSEVMQSLSHIINTLTVKVDSISVSRLDICVDFMTDVELATINDNQWVTRAKMFSRHTESENFTGWSIGRGGVMARLYDKTRECLKSNKQYFYPVWKNNGWKNDDQVWRLEFQFRREVLTELNCLSVKELENNLSSLWFYATCQWLRFTIPSTTDTARTRWVTHPLWEMLSLISWKTLPNKDIYRVRKERIPSDDYLYTTGLGAITSYMAREGINSLTEAIESYVNAAKQYHDSKGRITGKFFHHYVIEKKALKSRRYNTLRNNTESQKIEYEEQLKKKSKEYKDKSDGE